MNLFVEILSFSSGRKTTKHQFDLVYIMCTECEMKQTLFFILKKKIHKTYCSNCWLLRRKYQSFLAPKTLLSELCN